MAESNFYKEVKFYHGTTRKALPGILREGIMPRSTEELGSWPHEASRVGLVYLTQTHAVHYAVAPARKHKADDVILEVSLTSIPESRIYPDEDYLEQETWDGAAHQDDPSWSLDIAEQKHLWRASLEKLGNVAVEGIIPPMAITRYVILSRDLLFWKIFDEPDSARLITRYEQKKASVQDNLRFLFDTVPDLKGLPLSELDRLYSGQSREERERIRRIVRSVQVVTLSEGKVISKTTRNLPFEPMP